MMPILFQQFESATLVGFQEPSTPGPLPGSPLFNPFQKSGEKMKPEDEKRIREFNDALGEPVRIFIHLTDDPRSAQIKDFCDRLSQLAPKVGVFPDEDDLSALPSIRINQRLRYRGVPSQKELGPFLDALAGLNSEKPGIEASLAETLQRVSPPAEILLYVTPHCQYCPKAFRQLMPLPIHLETVYLTVIDGMLFDDLSQKDNVRSVPTVVLDGQFRWTGTLPLDELADAVTKRDPSELSKASLMRIAVNGGAGDLADMMMAHGGIFPAFYELLLEPNFTVRLAAMVTMEELIENAPHVARQAAGPLGEGLDQAIDQVKGDVIYLLGELKSVDSIPLIQSTLEKSDNPEIVETAREALEAIGRQR